jgi:hypothetical protein
MGWELPFGIPLFVSRVVTVYETDARDLEMVSVVATSGLLGNLTHP